MDRNLIQVIGEEGKGEYQFTQPRGVCINPETKEIFVVDCNNHRVQVFHLLSLAFIKQIGKGGNSNGTVAQGNLNYPVGICIDDNKTLFIADTNNHRIVVYNSFTGNYLRSIGTQGQGPACLNCPYGVSVDVSTKFLYIADYENNRVQIFHSETGDFINTFGGEREDSTIKFLKPIDVCVDSDSERLFVADYSNNKIQIINKITGELIHTIYNTSEFNSFNGPRSISFNKQSNLLFITDRENHRIQLYNLQTYEFIRHIGGGSGNDLGQFYRPMQVCTDNEEGVIIVVDGYNHRLQIIEIPELADEKKRIHKLKISKLNLTLNKNIKPKPDEFTLQQLNSIPGNNFNKENAENLEILNTFNIGPYFQPLPFKSEANLALKQQVANTTESASTASASSNVIQNEIKRQSNVFLNLLFNFIDVKDPEVLAVSIPPSLLALNSLFFKGWKPSELSKDVFLLIVDYLSSLERNHNNFNEGISLVKAITNITTGFIRNHSHESLSNLNIIDHLFSNLYQLMDNHDPDSFGEHKSMNANSLSSESVNVERAFNNILASLSEIDNGMISFLQRLYKVKFILDENYLLNSNYIRPKSAADEIFNCLLGVGLSKKIPHTKKQLIEFYQAILSLHFRPMNEGDILFVSNAKNSLFKAANNYFKNIRDRDDKKNERKTRGGRNIWNLQDPMAIGDLVDCMDKERSWFESMIVDVSVDGSVKVHFLGWGSRWDDIIPPEDIHVRVRPLNSHTKNWRSELFEGGLIEIKCNDDLVNQKWMWGRITKLNIDRSWIEVTYSFLNEPPVVKKAWLYGETICPIGMHTKDKSKSAASTILKPGKSIKELIQEKIKEELMENEILFFEDYNSTFWKFHSINHLKAKDDLNLSMKDTKDVLPISSLEWISLYSFNKLMYEILSTIGDYIQKVFKRKPRMKSSSQSSLSSISQKPKNNVDSIFPSNSSSSFSFDDYQTSEDENLLQSIESMIGMIIQKGYHQLIAQYLISPLYFQAGFQAKLIVTKYDLSDFVFPDTPIEHLNVEEILRLPIVLKLSDELFILSDVYKEIIHFLFEKTLSKVTVAFIQDKLQITILTSGLQRISHQIIQLFLKYPILLKDLLTKLTFKGKSSVNQSSKIRKLFRILLSYSDHHHLDLFYPLLENILIRNPLRDILQILHNESYHCEIKLIEQIIGTLELTMNNLSNHIFLQERLLYSIEHVLCEEIQVLTSIPAKNLGKVLAFSLIYVLFEDYQHTTISNNIRLLDKLMVFLKNIVNEEAEYYFEHYLLLYFSYELIQHQNEYKFFYLERTILKELNCWVFLEALLDEFDMSNLVNQSFYRFVDDKKYSFPPNRFEIQMENETKNEIDSQYLYSSGQIGSINHRQFSALVISSNWQIFKFSFPYSELKLTEPMKCMLKDYELFWRQYQTSDSFQNHKNENSTSPSSDTESTPAKSIPHITKASESNQYKRLNWCFGLGQIQLIGWFDDQMKYEITVNEIQYLILYYLSKAPYNKLSISELSSFLSLDFHALVMVIKSMLLAKNSVISHQRSNTAENFTPLDEVSLILPGSSIPFYEEPIHNLSWKIHDMEKLKPSMDWKFHIIDASLFRVYKRSLRENSSTMNMSEISLIMSTLKDLREKKPNSIFTEDEIRMRIAFYKKHTNEFDDLWTNHQQIILQEAFGEIFKEKSSGSMIKSFPLFASLSSKKLLTNNTSDTSEFNGFHSYPCVLKKLQNIWNIYEKELIKHSFQLNLAAPLFELNEKSCSFDYVDQFDPLICDINLTLLNENLESNESTKNYLSFNCKGNQFLVSLLVTLMVNNETKFNINSLQSTSSTNFITPTPDELRNGPSYNINKSITDSMKKFLKTMTIIIGGSIHQMNLLIYEVVIEKENKFSEKYVFDSRPACIDYFLAIQSEFLKKELPSRVLQRFKLILFLHLPSSIINSITLIFLSIIPHDLTYTNHSSTFSKFSSQSKNFLSSSNEFDSLLQCWTESFLFTPEAILSNAESDLINPESMENFVNFLSSKLDYGSSSMDWKFPSNSPMCTSSKKKNKQIKLSFEDFFDFIILFLRINNSSPIPPSDLLSTSSKGLYKSPSITQSLKRSSSGFISEAVIKDSSDKSELLIKDEPFKSDSSNSILQYLDDLQKLSINLTPERKKAFFHNNSKLPNSPPRQPPLFSNSQVSEPSVLIPSTDNLFDYFHSFIDSFFTLFMNFSTIFWLSNTSIEPSTMIVRKEELLLDISNMLFSEIIIGHKHFCSKNVIWWSSKLSYFEIINDSFELINKLDCSLETNLMIVKDDDYPSVSPPSIPIECISFELPMTTDPLVPVNKSASYLLFCDLWDRYLEPSPNFRLKTSYDEIVNQVSKLLQIPSNFTGILLARHDFDISKTLDDFYQSHRMQQNSLKKPLSYLSNISLTADKEDKTNGTKKSQIICISCFHLRSLNEMFALSCGHFACRFCWSNYLNQSIESVEKTYRITSSKSSLPFPLLSCIRNTSDSEIHCTAIFDEFHLDQFIDSTKQQSYLTFLIDQSKNQFEKKTSYSYGTSLDPGGKSTDILETLMRKIPEQLKYCAIDCASRSCVICDTVMFSDDPNIRRESIHEDPIYDNIHKEVIRIKSSMLGQFNEANNSDQERDSVNIFLTSTSNSRPEFNFPKLVQSYRYLKILFSSRLIIDHLNLDYLLLSTIDRDMFDYSKQFINSLPLLSYSKSLYVFVRKIFRGLTQLWLRIPEPRIIENIKVDLFTRNKSLHLSTFSECPMFPLLPNINPHYQAIEIPPGTTLQDYLDQLLKLLDNDPVQLVVQLINANEYLKSKSSSILSISSEEKEAFFQFWNQLHSIFQNNSANPDILEVILRLYSNLLHFFSILEPSFLMDNFSCCQKVIDWFKPLLFASWTLNMTKETKEDLSWGLICSLLRQFFEISYRLPNSYESIVDCNLIPIEFILFLSTLPCNSISSIKQRNAFQQSLNILLDFNCQICNVYMNLSPLELLVDNLIHKLLSSVSSKDIVEITSIQTMSLPVIESECCPKTLFTLFCMIINEISKFQPKFFKNVPEVQQFNDDQIDLLPSILGSGKLLNDFFSCLIDFPIKASLYQDENSLPKKLNDSIILVDPSTELDYLCLEHFSAFLISDKSLGILFQALNSPFFPFIIGMKLKYLFSLFEQVLKRTDLCMQAYSTISKVLASYFNKYPHIIDVYKNSEIDLKPYLLDKREFILLHLESQSLQHDSMTYNQRSFLQVCLLHLNYAIFALEDGEGHEKQFSSFHISEDVGFETILHEFQSLEKSYENVLIQTQQFEEFDENSDILSSENDEEDEEGDEEEDAEGEDENESEQNEIISENDSTTSDDSGFN